MNPSSLDCADCEARLLDLLELRRSGDGEIRRGIDTLLARCPGCRERFEILEEGLSWAAELPMEEPPRQIDAVVMAAARARAGAVTRPSRRGLSGAIEGGFWDRLVQRLGGLAMRPQVTMATLTLLVVTLGVWTLRPSARQARLPEAGEVVVDPDPMGEAAPSYAPAPEELAAADRRGRGEAQKSLRDAQGSPRVVAESGETPGESAAIPESDRAAGAVQRAADDGAGAGQKLAQGPRREAAGSSRGRRALRRGMPADSAEGRASGAREGSGRGAGGADGAGGGTAGAADDDALGALAGAGRLTDEAQAGREATRGRTSAAARPPPAQVREEELEAAPSNAGAPAAAPTAAPEVPTLAAQLHERARAAARAGRHREAIGHYRNLLARFPSYLRRGTALLELGDAYRAAGRLADARRAYERAGRHPEVAARARRRRDAMDSPAAPAAADEPAAAEAE